MKSKRICTVVKSYPDFSVTFSAEISTFKYFIIQFLLNASCFKNSAWGVGDQVFESSCCEAKESTLRYFVGWKIGE